MRGDVIDPRVSLCGTCVVFFFGQTASLAQIHFSSLSFNGRGDFRPSSGLLCFSWDCYIPSLVCPNKFVCYVLSLPGNDILFCLPQKGRCRALLLKLH